MVSCSTLTVTVGMLSAVATTVLGISCPETIFHPAGTCGFTSTVSPVLPLSGVCPTSLPSLST
ncbi:MAG: hypothetical protein N4R38_03430 [Lactobacillus crispatus]|nr:hypothetical protein [Lactobacillus crispatus]